MQTPMRPTQHAALLPRKLPRIHSRNLARAIGAAAAVAALAPLGGCEWWLTFQTGGASMAEALLQSGGYHIENGTLVPNSPPPPPAPAPTAPAPGVSGGGGGGGSGGGGAAPMSPAPLSQPSPDAAKAPEAPPPAPVTMTIAGRLWRVVEARSAPIGEGDERAVSVEMLIEHTGLTAAARVRVPIAQWPVDSSGAPTALAWSAPRTAGTPIALRVAMTEGDEGAGRSDPLRDLLGGAPRLPALPLAWPLERTGIDVAGQRYEIVVTAAALARSDESPLLPIAGVIDATARREASGSTRGTNQLVRVRFAPEVIERDSHAAAR